MRLKIGDSEIPESTLTSVVSVLGTPTVTFSGVAKGDEGSDLIRILKQSARKDSISFEAVDVTGTSSAGTCKLFNLKCEEVTTRPRLVIYSGELLQSY